MDDARLNPKHCNNGQLATKSRIEKGSTINLEKGVGTSVPKWLDLTG